MSAVLTDVRPPARWQVALPAALLLAATILLLYRETAAAMVGIWSRSDTFTHAFLVPPIAAWLVWRRRAALAALTPRPQPWLLLPLAAAAAAWLVGDIALVNAATQFALVTMLVLAVPALLGRRVTRVLLFPLLFLYFAVPFGEFLLPLLMTSTADFVVFALQLTGIPVYREGLQFVIPSGNWSVVEACSGVRYLIASTMVGTLFAYLNYSSTSKRLVFVAVSIAVPVVANWLRAYLIVMLGHLSGNTIAVGVDHLIYGWLFFGVVIGALYFIGARWADADIDAPLPPAATPGQQPAASPALGAAVALAAALLVALPAALSHAVQPAAAPLPPLVLPDAAPGWTRQAGPLFDFHPHYVLPAATAEAGYAGADGRAVGVYVAYYRAQTAGSKLVNSQNVPVSSDEHDWNLLATAPATVAGGLGVRESQALGPVRPGGRRPQLTIWSLDRVDGRWLASPAAAKAQAVLQRLAGRGDDAAALVLYTDDESPAAARARLAAYARDHLGAIEAMLRRAEDTQAKEAP